MTSDGPAPGHRLPSRTATGGRALRWRLTTWYAGVFGIGLTLVAIGSLVTLAVVLEQRSDRYLRAAWRAFTTELLVEATEFASADSAIAMTQKEVRFEDTHFVVSPAENRLAEAIESRAVNDDVPGAASVAVLALSTREGAAGGTRLATGTVAFHQQRWSVIAEHPRAPLQETVTAVALTYAFAFPLLLGIALAGGYAMARRALAPVAAMGRQARAIEATTLHDRLPVDDPHDELGELAGVINALLARLEAAFDQQRRLVADASHELRTPVSVLLAEADVLLARRGRPEAEYRERVGVLRDAAARLARLVDDLFLLTRADSGQLVPRREPLYFDEVISDAVRAMQAVSALRRVHLTLVIAPSITTPADTPSDGEAGVTGVALPGALLEGDPALLDRLLLNLLDNAIKFAPRGGHVTVTLDREWTHASRASYVLRVTDDGPGIAPDAQPFVFDRFFRADQSRTRGHESNLLARGTEGGAGLGLAIARWVAEGHGGTLALEHSSKAGTTMRLDLPAELDVASPDLRAAVASGS